MQAPPLRRSARLGAGALHERQAGRAKGRRSARKVGGAHQASMWGLLMISTTSCRKMEAMPSASGALGARASSCPLKGEHLGQHLGGRVGGLAGGRAGYGCVGGKGGLELVPRALAWLPGQRRCRSAGRAARCPQLPAPQPSARQPSSAAQQRSPAAQPSSAAPAPGGGAGEAVLDAPADAARAAVAEGVVVAAERLRVQAGGGAGQLIWSKPLSRQPHTHSCFAPQILERQQRQPASSGQPCSGQPPAASPLAASPVAASPFHPATPTPSPPRRMRSRPR
jgi:hypothetical protein